MNRYVVLTAAIISLSFHAASAVHLTAPLGVVGEPGQELVLPINVDNATGVLGYFLDIGYDSSVLEYVGTDKGSLTLAWNAPTANSQTGHFSLAGFGAQALEGAGSLADVRLRVKASATNGQYSALHFIGAELNDGAIPLTTTDGRVDVVVTIHVTADVNVDAPPGAIIDIPVTVNDASGVLGYYVSVTYDPAVLDYLDTQRGPLTLAWANPTVNTLPGALTLAAFGASMLSGSGALVVVQLQVRSGAVLGTNTVVHVASAELNDGAIPTITADGHIGVRNAAPLAAWPILLVLAVFGGASTLRRTFL